MPEDRHEDGDADLQPGHVEPLVSEPADVVAHLVAGEDEQPALVRRTARGSVRVPRAGSAPGRDVDAEEVHRIVLPVLPVDGEVEHHRALLVRVVAHHAGNRQPQRARPAPAARACRRRAAPKVEARFSDAITAWPPAACGGTCRRGRPRAPRGATSGRAPATSVAISRIRASRNGTRDCRIRWTCFDRRPRLRAPASSRRGTGSRGRSAWASP